MPAAKARSARRPVSASAMPRRRNAARTPTEVSSLSPSSGAVQSAGAGRLAGRGVAREHDHAAGLAAPPQRVDGVLRRRPGPPYASPWAEGGAAVVLVRLGRDELDPVHREPAHLAGVPTRHQRQPALDLEPGGEQHGSTAGASCGMYSRRGHAVARPVRGHELRDVARRRLGALVGDGVVQVAVVVDRVERGRERADPHALAPADGVREHRGLDPAKRSRSGPRRRPRLVRARPARARYART